MEFIANFIINIIIYIRKIGEYMKKDLPGLYKGHANKEINKKVYYSWDKDDNDIRNSRATTSIDSLLNSGSYIFNTKVLIKTKNKNYETRIAGKMGNKIITFDNDAITISEIVDIKILGK